MKLTFTVDTESKTAEYTTVALKVSCDDPNVGVSLSQTNSPDGEGRLFLRTSPAGAPLQLGETRDMILVEDAPEGGEGME